MTRLTADSDSDRSRIESDVCALLEQVEDPELPVSIIDLGMVREVQAHAGEAGASRCTVDVQLVPTFLGCPAQLFIERDVRQALQNVASIAEVRIIWVPAEQWQLGDISARGREALRRIGVAIPDDDGRARCPHCDSDAVVIDSEFGASLCRRLAHCETCGENVELMRSRPRRHTAPAE